MRRCSDRSRRSRAAFAGAAVVPAPGEYWLPLPCYRVTRRILTLRTFKLNLFHLLSAAPRVVLTTTTGLSGKFLGKHTSKHKYTHTHTHTHLYTLWYSHTRSHTGSHAVRVEGIACPRFTRSWQRRIVVLGAHSKSSLLRSLLRLLCAHAFALSTCALPFSLSLSLSRCQITANVSFTIWEAPKKLALLCRVLRQFSNQITDSTRRGCACHSMLQVFVNESESCARPVLGAAPLCVLANLPRLCMLTVFFLSI